MPPLQVLNFLLMVLNCIDKIEISKVMVEEVLIISETKFPTEYQMHKWE